ncbi:unnamed protein product [Sphenostylis stenocarpa]|uniref:Phytocyanin domain-containing protein n=1 Tax=Sphenostylis stenocarpa TaxID=92480 RepID=A0AA86S817_9FABA|nr:unnamed protein product [Sphenostylis stenocarpa]
MVDARTFVVGIADGSCSEDICWTFNASVWSKDKVFLAGDVLVFNYKPSVHNVVAVDEEGYKTCKASKNAVVYETGHDRIQLPEGGDSFFISTVASDCQRGMRIEASYV